MALGYPLQMLISTKPGVSAATKYNRGFDYLVLIAWPLLAHVWWRRRWWAVCVLGLTTAVILVVTLSLAARVAVAAGLVVLVLAWVLPRLVEIALACATVAYGLVLPLALRLIAARRDELAPLLKASGLHRLEIWDYMTARVLERPVLGWGLLSAKSLPIHPDELAHYVYVRPAGVYPHNQFLELWVELGVLGAVLGLIFAVLVLRRVRRLPPRMRPFAYAAFASAMAVASVDYEIVTDSWWCALAASALLFGMLGHLVADANVDGRTG
jgi:O-antigen ligase